MKLEQSTAAPMSTYRYGMGMSGFLQMDSKQTEWEKVDLYLFIALNSDLYWMHPVIIVYKELRFAESLFDSLWLPELTPETFI